MTIRTFQKLASMTLLTLSVTAFADDKTHSAFAGPYIRLGAGEQYNHIFNENVRATTGFLSFNQPSASSHDFLGQVLAGYGFDIGENFNVSTNIFYNFGDKKVNDIRATWYHDTVKQELKNSVGFYLAPGYKFNDTTLVFLKLGYASADKKYIRDTITPSISLNDSVNGYLWGVGIKHLLTENIFLGIDLTKHNYGNTSQTTNLKGLSVNVSSKNEQTNALISIGYKF